MVPVLLAYASPLCLRLAAGDTNNSKCSRSMVEPEVGAEGGAAFCAEIAFGVVSWMSS